MEERERSNEGDNRKDKKEDGLRAKREGRDESEERIKGG